jgi:charged multivesicular body protein 3
MLIFLPSVPFQMGLFGKSKAPDPKEQVNEWSKKIRKEGHQLERQINQIKREEAKVVRSIKECAKRGDNEAAKLLAKEVVQSRKAVTRIYTAKANLSSVEMQMRNQAAQIRLAGSLQKSTEVMKAMQQLVKLPELQKTMMEMSKEMMKVGCQVLGLF